MIIKPAGTQMGRRLLKLSIRQELTNGNVKSVKGLFKISDLKKHKNDDHA
jgi:hypothetical protein